MDNNDKAQVAAIWSAARTLLSAAGGLLVAHGLTSQETMQDVVGAIMVLAPLIWGVVAKFRAESKAKVREHIALQAGVQAEREGKLESVPATAIGPLHAQAIIQEAKQELKI